MKMNARQRNHVIVRQSDALVDRQMRYDAKETYRSTCSMAKCKARPDYQYTFEVFSPAHEDWQIRDYFYCAQHMESIAQGKEMQITLLKHLCCSGR